nr:DctP family TRAP transporter solute-binding subunit [uncultured Desulfobulbus sp.]
MKEKKWRIITITILYSLHLTIVLAPTSNAYSKDQATYVMRLATGYTQSNNHFMWTAFEVLKQEVESRSQGKFKVHIYSQTMGKASADIIEEVKDGLVDAWAFSSGHCATVYPPLQVLYIPYLFAQRDIAWEVLDGPFGQKLIEDMAQKTGLRPLYWIENGGFRHYSNNKRPIHSPIDMKGLKIRTMETPLHMKIVSDLGGRPVPIPWGQLYDAINAEIVDGQENSIATFMVPHLEEVQNFITLDAHVYGVYTILMNNDWYQSLPDEMKNILNQAKKVSATVNRGLSLSNNIAGIHYLQSKGVDVYTPSTAEKAEFRKRTQQSALQWLKKHVGSSWVEGALHATQEAEKKLGYKPQTIEVQ